MPISKEDDKSSWEQYHTILLSHIVMYWIWSLLDSDESLVVTRISPPIFGLQHCCRFRKRMQLNRGGLRLNTLILYFLFHHLHHFFLFSFFNFPSFCSLYFFFFSLVQYPLLASVIFEILPRFKNRGILKRGQKASFLASVITRSHRSLFCLGCWEIEAIDSILF